MGRRTWGGIEHFRHAGQQACGGEFLPAVTPHVAPQHRLKCQQLLSQRLFHLAPPPSPACLVAQVPPRHQDAQTCRMTGGGIVRSVAFSEANGLGRGGGGVWVLLFSLHASATASMQIMSIFQRRSRYSLRWEEQGRTHACHVQELQICDLWQTAHVALEHAVLARCLAIVPIGGVPRVKYLGAL